MLPRRFLFAVSVLFLYTSLAAAQDSLGDAARKLREAKEKAPSARVGPAAQTTEVKTAAPPAAAKDQQSLADIAKKLSTGKKPDVVVNEEDAKGLFKQIDEILRFASEDTGMPIRTPVKHRLAGRDEVDKKMAAAVAEDEERKQLERSEVVLKKFGMLPADFDFQKFYSEGAGQGLAGFYDFHEKTMYLLNWIELVEQRPVMAHELTHALQDQNFNLTKWSDPSKAAGMRGKDPASQDDDEEEARRAAVEGQAMIVYLDYLIRPRGRSLASANQSIESLKSELMGIYESPVEVHSAPLLLKETTYFPYFDGFAFELEILKRQGTQTAFAGVFAHPPKDTHEIMHPDDYMARVHPAQVKLPNLAATLAGFKLFDSGAIGELDVRVMVKVFGRDNDAYTVAPMWNGGSYQAWLKPSAATKTSAAVSQGDLALVYVSKWKSYAAAQRFADLYRTGLLRRSHTTGTTNAVECEASAKGCGPRWSAHFQTEDGPVLIEIAADNTILIMQGLEDTQAAQVKQALADKSGRIPAAHEKELSLRFAAHPEVQALRNCVAAQILQSMMKVK